MKKPFLSTMHSLLILIILPMLVAGVARESTPRSLYAGSKSNDFSKNIQIPSPLYLDTLNILWIEAIKFTQVKGITKRKITFRFHVQNSNALTMHGWLNNKRSHKFDTTKYQPDLEFLLGKKSQIPISVNDYLGNLVLYKEQIKELINLINSTKLKYVLFIPEKPGPKFNQISFRIALTDSDPNKDGDNAAPPYETNLYTNPSPPRNSY
jgi:hypothetical protein